MKPRFFRALCIAVVGLASAVVVFLSISYILSPLLLWLSPSLNPTLYDWGAYGACPLQSFVTTDLVAPRVNTRRTHPDCGRGLVLLTINGDSAGPKGPAILDARNELVWKSQGYGSATNLQVQHYKGQNYLTFWAGRKVGTKGTGMYYMVSWTFVVSGGGLMTWKLIGVIISWILLTMKHIESWPSVTAWRATSMNSKSRKTTLLC